MLDKIILLVCGLLAGLSFNLSKVLYSIAYENSINYIRTNYLKKDDSKKEVQK